jgi:hypothetical protein
MGGANFVEETKIMTPQVRRQIDEFFDGLWDLYVLSVRDLQHGEPEAGLRKLAEGRRLLEEFGRKLAKEVA